MRCLITGASGQVGSELVRRLQGIDVVATDRAILDLAAPEAIAAKFDAFAPDLIINAAAYTAVDRAEDERELAFIVNSAAPEAIARWAAAHLVPLIHFSTDYVFDGSGTRPWREDDPAGPLNVYGASKLAGERAIRACGGAHLIVRTSWVYAAQGKNFLRTIVRLAGERDELRVVSDQIGAPTSAACIADAVVGIIGSDPSKVPAAFASASGLVNVAAGGSASWSDFATAIVSGLRPRGVAVKAQRVAPIETADYPTKARRPLNSRLDLTRLRAAFGFEPKSWQEYLAAELDLLAAEPR